MLASTRAVPKIEINSLFLTTQTWPVLTLAKRSISTYKKFERASDDLYLVALELLSQKEIRAVILETCSPKKKKKR